MDKLVESLQSLHRLVVLGSVVLLVFAFEATPPFFYGRGQLGANAVARSQAQLFQEASKAADAAFRREWNAAIERDGKLTAAERGLLRDVVEMSAFAPAWAELRSAAPTPAGDWPAQPVRVPLRPADLMLSQMVEINGLMVPPGSRTHVSPAPPSALRVQVPMATLDATGLMHLNRMLLRQKLEVSARLLLVVPPDDSAGPEGLCLVFVQDLDKLDSALRRVSYRLKCTPLAPLETEHRFDEPMLAADEGLMPLLQRMDGSQLWSDAEPALKTVASAERANRATAGAMDFLSLKMSGESLRLIGPLVLAALLAQMLTITSLAGRAPDTPVATAAPGWFGMFCGGRLFMMLVTLVLLPVAATLAPWHMADGARGLPFVMAFVVGAPACWAVWWNRRIASRLGKADRRSAPERGGAFTGAAGA